MIFLRRLEVLTQFSYPIICTDKFSETMAYYEDHLGFAPAFEIKGFAIMKREEYADVYIAVIDARNEEIPEAYRRPVSGMILNFPVEDVEQAHSDLYLEGLDIVSEPKMSMCGRKHFFVEDPNGILINVAENVALEETMAPEQLTAVRVPA